MFSALLHKLKWSTAKNGKPESQVRAVKAGQQPSADRRRLRRKFYRGFLETFCSLCGENDTASGGTQHCVCISGASCFLKKSGAAGD